LCAATGVLSKKRLPASIHYSGRHPVCVRCAPYAFSSQNKSPDALHRGLLCVLPVSFAQPAGIIKKSSLSNCQTRCRNAPCTA
jgi:hypothetical protein